MAKAIRMIPKDLARRFHILPLTFEANRNRLTLAMADTFNVVALDQITALIGGDTEIVPLMAGEAEIEKAIDQFYGFELSVDGILQEIETGEIDYESLDADSQEYSQPVVRLVNALLADAVSAGPRTSISSPRRFPAFPLPDRRCTAPGAQPAQELLVRAGGAAEGHVGDGYR